MQSILLKNFKSYEQQSINNLNSRINVILGANGQGKSNFFKAISFLFTDKFTINRAEFNGTLYRGAKNENPEILVQVNFSQKSQGEKPYKIGKSWTDYTHEDLKINDKSKNKGEYENFIESFGLSYANPYHIVQQGKIAYITQMNQSQLYFLLQETAGVKRFYKKQEEAHNNLAKIQSDLGNIEQDLKYLKDKVSQVEDKKNQYEFYSVEQKVRKIKKKRQLNNYLSGIAKTLQKMKEKHLQVVKQLQQTKIKQKDLLWEIQEKQRNLKILSEKAVFYEKQNSQGIEESISVSKKSISAKKKQLKQLQKKIATQQKGLLQSQNNLANLQKQLNVYRQKYEAIKVDFEVQGEAKDLKKIKQAYQSKIQTQKQAIKSMEEESKKIIKLQGQFKPVNYSTQSKQLKDLQIQLSPILEQMKRLRIQQIQLGRNKMNSECQIQTLLGRRKNLDETVKKLLPMMDFRLLKWLQENKIQGVYGYLMDHLKIDSNVAFAYELSGLSKLCTLLVEDDNVAAKVVEINKKIHGKNINILPLSFVKSQAVQKRSYPKMDNVFSLINKDWINLTNPQKFSNDVRSSIQKVVNNTFSKYALVEDYTTALNVSKQYNLNCITADREIVYADAYMCKVGREEFYEKGKIQLFQILQNMNKDILKNKNKLNAIEKRQVELQNQQIQLINKKQKFQLKINQIQKSIDEAKKVEAVIQKLQAKNITLNQSIQRSNRTVQQYETALKNMQNNVKSKFREEDFKKAESEYFVHKSKVQKIFSQNYQKEKNLSNMLKDLQIVTKQVSNIEQKNQSPDLQSKQQILRQIEDQKHKIQEESSNLNKQLNKIIDKRSQLKQKQVGLLAELTVEQENQKDIRTKIQSYEDINPEQEQQIQQLSHSLSRKLPADSINAKKRQFYTARDKVFFTKITQYIQKVNHFNESTKTITKQKQKLQNYIKETQNEAKQYMKSFVSNFEKHFIRYFLRIVPNGKAELKSKVHAQKIKGITKNAHSLEIKVSFNELQGIRKWSQFSGGQKTVLALCIILAIQKCQPTPFCVLDQVDAALDPYYAKQIMNIIVEQSEFCQYFITSFKKSMLDFPENITNYYLVKSVNRISNITKVQKTEVQSFIEEIAE